MPLRRHLRALFIVALLTACTTGVLPTRTDHPASADAPPGRLGLTLGSFAPAPVATGVIDHRHHHPAPTSPGSQTP